MVIINEIKGDPHSLSLPLATHISLNAKPHRKIKINYTFCGRLHRKLKCTGLAFLFPFLFFFFEVERRSNVAKILKYASKCCMLACF